MRAVILAAGFGQRLMPLTKDVPKCMVSYQGKRIIDYALEALLGAGVREVCIVGGYKFDVLQDYVRSTYPTAPIQFYCNESYAKSNMVTTLFCARAFLEQCAKDSESVLISYADIVYFHTLVEKLANCGHEIGVVIDRKWRELWSLRFSDPLSDAETLKLDRGRIIELGKKPKGYHEIEGQYIGLFRVSATFLREFISFYDGLNRACEYDSKDFDNMYMTSFLQLLIQQYKNVYMVETHGNWCEIDFMSDLEISYIRG